MRLRDILVALRATWWLPALGLLLGASVGLGVSLLTTPQYTARTELFVSTADSATTADVYQGSEFSQQRVASYLQLLDGDEVARRVIDRLALPLTPGQVSSEIRASSVPNTVLLDVTVTDTSPRRAAEIAGAVGDEFSKMVSELETPDGVRTSPVKVTVVERPQVPSVPTEPQTTRSVVVGLIAGLVLGAGGAVLRARMDQSIRNPNDVMTLTGVPVIGTILRDDALVKGHVLGRAARSRTAEDYRQLRVNLQFLNVDEPPKVIMVTSALPSEGKTTLTINLALALVEAGRRVTILEADLRRPRVARYLGMVGGVGLTNILAGTADFDDVLQSYGEGGLSVIGSGPQPPNPGELLGSSHMSALLDKLRGLNDFVILDTPPLLPVADSTGLAGFVDGVLMSVRYGSTRSDQLKQAALALERVHAKTLGVILNIVPPKAEEAAAYGYGYAYEYGVERRGRRGD